MKVQRILSNNLTAELSGDDFLVRKGSAACSIRVTEFSDDSTLVRLGAPVLFEVPITDDLYRYVAQHSNTWRFGALGLNESDDGTTIIDFTHTLLGDTVDEAELLWAVGAVTSTADDLDDELQSKFGGKRVGDLGG
ncbi:MAG: YbjN domain-containing protein [Actinomycetota bacterium]|nr:YbjN domain-containing protein [Actinomycetota bacterium]